MYFVRAKVQKIFHLTVFKVILKNNWFLCISLRFGYAQRTEMQFFSRKFLKTTFE